jgi:hypothetical protein
VDRHRFDANPDPDLDRHNNGNPMDRFDASPDPDLDRHFNGNPDPNLPIHNTGSF